MKYYRQIIEDTQSSHKYCPPFKKKKKISTTKHSNTELVSSSHLLTHLQLRLMEWSDYHSHVTIVGLRKVRKTGTQIFTLLKSQRISQKFVYRTIQRYNETGNAVDHPHAGHPHTTRTSKVVEAVRSRI